MSDFENKRHRGRVTSVQAVDGTIFVHLDFGGVTQTFGGIALDGEAMDAFRERLCVLFRAKSLDAIVGTECIALTCLGEPNETIEGLERIDDGARFTLGEFRRWYCPGTRSALDQRAIDMRRRIMDLERQLAEERTKLASLVERWTNWETEGRVVP